MAIHAVSALWPIRVTAAGAVSVVVAAGVDVADVGEVAEDWELCDGSVFVFDFAAWLGVTGTVGGRVIAIAASATMTAPPAIMDHFAAGFFHRWIIWILLPLSDPLRMIPATLGIRGSCARANSSARPACCRLRREVAHPGRAGDRMSCRRLRTSSPAEGAIPQECPPA